MEKQLTKPKKKVVIEYFTDEMAKSIYAFQEQYKGQKGGKPIMKSVSFKTKR